MAEIFRVLKPGQLFGGYEWCLTDKYDPSNPQHRQIKKVGSSLPPSPQWGLPLVPPVQDS
jgi:sterol 24-C-methyltransferase